MENEITLIEKINSLKNATTDTSVSDIKSNIQNDKIFKQKIDMLRNTDKDVVDLIIESDEEWEQIFRDSEIIPLDELNNK